LKSIRGDLFGGVTAAVVALPLALAFGVASGIGPIAGVYGAIAVGFFAAVFGGTPTQVSGPTGPMTVVMAVIVAEHAGNIQEAFAIVFLGGLIQALFGVIRVGRFVSYTPYSVISGFMSGIGAIIIVIQILPFLGAPTAEGGPLGSLRALPAALGSFNWQAAVLALVSLGAMIAWPHRLRSVLPPPLAALLVGTLLGVFLLRDAPVIGEVPTGLPHFALPAFPLSEIAGFLQPALVLALLASIDSLLTSLVADSITRTQHDSNRELIGQGIGNMAASLFGGLPGAGATMRTVVNIRAGGRSRLSGATHAVILLALVLGLGPLAERIPHAVLAGILMKVGWDIIDWGYLRRIRKAPTDKVVVMLVTLGLTVFVDLITAVAVGLIFAAFATARWMEREELKGVTATALPAPGDGMSEEETAALGEHDGKIMVVSLRGRFSYASARELIKRVAPMTQPHKAIVYDFTSAAHVDTTTAISLEELFKRATDARAHCVIAGLSGVAEKTLASLGVLEVVPAENIRPTLLEAIERAGALLTEEANG
jgi:SulP family sulfate permease